MRAEAGSHARPDRHRPLFRRTHPRLPGAPLGPTRELTRSTYAGPPQSGRPLSAVSLEPAWARSALVRAPHPAGAWAPRPAISRRRLLALLRRALGERQSGAGAGSLI